MAVDLHAGDSLVFDPHNTHKLGAGDTQLVRVTAGGAIAFFTDTATLKTQFTLGNFTGLAVTDGFKGVLGANVFGPVGVMATISGNVISFSGAAPGSIAGLKMTGHIHGDLFAEGNISNVTIINPPASNSGLASVTGMIATGSAKPTAESFDAGFNSIAIAVGFDGGNISNVKLANGAGKIVAGAGANGTTGGAGGIYRTW